MHNIYANSNWMFGNLEMFLRKIKGYKNISNLIFHKYWIKSVNSKKINETEKKINNLIKSKNFLITREI